MRSCHLQKQIGRISEAAEQNIGQSGQIGHPKKGHAEKLEKNRRPRPHKVAK